MKNTLLGSLYLSLASSIWGGMYVVVKVVVDIVPPLELVWLRYVIALIALLMIGVITKQSWRVAKRDWLLIMLIGLIGNTISIVTQEVGTMLSSAQMGAIITSTTPAFMVLFARIILKEKNNCQESHFYCFSNIWCLRYCWKCSNRYLQSAGWRIPDYRSTNVVAYVCSCKACTRALFANCRNKLQYPCSHCLSNSFYNWGIS